VRYRGLLAPGSDRLSGEEDLVAVWRTTGGHRFQNYRARFTVLDVPSVSRAWISELASSQATGAHCPDPWRTWVEAGRYTPLLAPPTVIIRSREAQHPPAVDKPLLSLVYEHFKERPHDFEQFAADLMRRGYAEVDRATSPARGATADVMPSATTSWAPTPTRSRSSSPSKPSATHPATAWVSGKPAGSSPGCATASSASWSPPRTWTARPTRKSAKTAIPSSSWPAATSPTS
jgi:AspBHI-like restriction endonuclease